MHTCSQKLSSYCGCCFRFGLHSSHRWSNCLLIGLLFEQSRVACCSRASFGFFREMTRLHLDYLAFLRFTHFRCEVFALSDVSYASYCTRPVEVYVNFQDLVASRMLSIISKALGGPKKCHTFSTGRIHVFWAIWLACLVAASSARRTAAVVVSGHNSADRALQRLSWSPLLSVHCL